MVKFTTRHLLSYVSTEEIYDLLYDDNKEAALIYLRGALNTVRYILGPGRDGHCNLIVIRDQTVFLQAIMNAVKRTGWIRQAIKTALTDDEYRRLMEVEEDEDRGGGGEDGAYDGLSDGDGGKLDDPESAYRKRASL